VRTIFKWILLPQTVLLVCVTNASYRAPAQDLSFTLIDVKVGTARGQRGILSRDGAQIGYDILDNFYVYDIAAGQIVTSVTPGVDQNGGAFNWFAGNRFALESSSRFEVFSALTGQSLSLIPRLDYPAVGARVAIFRPIITTSQIGYWVFDGDESVRGLYLNDQRVIDPSIVDPEVTVNEGVYEGFKDAAFTEEGIAYVVDFIPGINTGSRGRLVYTADTSGQNRNRIYDITGTGNKYSEIESVRLSGASRPSAGESLRSSRTRIRTSPEAAARNSIASGNMKSMERMSCSEGSVRAETGSIFRKMGFFERSSRRETCLKG